jgi:hypothetical protein
MDEINMHEAIDHDRRRLFVAAALAFTAAERGVIGTAHAEAKPAPLPAIKPGTNTSFAPLKQIDAGALNVGYAETGPPNGSPVILLHGWPHDIHSFVQFPAITVPTITMEGDANGALHPEPNPYAKKFTGRYEHRTVTGGIGHNLPQEAPQAFATAIVNVAEG